MPTDPNPSLAPNSPSESFPTEIAQALAAGLGPFSLREMLALILNSLGQAERQAYLTAAPTVGFAVPGPLARRSRLQSGSCTSARTFAPRFLRTPSRDDALALR